MAKLFGRILRLPYWDVFADVWNEIIPFLESKPEVEATTLLEYLSEQYPNRFADSQLRPLQRRIKQWRAVHGLPKEEFFPQEHLPGGRRKATLPISTS